MADLFILIYSEEEDCREDINATCVFHGLFTTKEAAQTQMKGLCETTLASELQDHLSSSVDGAEIREQYPVPETPQTEWYFDRGMFRIYQVTSDEQHNPLVLL